MAGFVKEVDRGWNTLFAIVRLMRDNKDAHVKVGVLDDGGKGSEDHEGLTTAELAAVHEFGTEDGRIPARSFVGSTYEANKERYFDDLAVLLSKLYEGKIDLRRVFDIMGARMANDIKRAVMSGEGIPPPNAPSTIERKGSDRTLLDTARMIGAVTWAVIMKGGESGSE